MKLILLLFLIFSFPLLTYPQQTFSLIVKLPKANIRQYPDTKSKVLETVDKKTKLTASAFDGNWYFVTFGTTRGWIHKSTVKKGKVIPRYIGFPETDSKFASFITKNYRKIVYLKISVIDGYGLTIGYKDGSPYFDSKKLNGIDYTYFIENCEVDMDLEEKYFPRCKEVNWDYVEYETSRGKNYKGQLTGYFKVSRIIRTSMRNYRAVFLSPIAVRTQ